MKLFPQPISAKWTRRNMLESQAEAVENDIYGYPYEPDTEDEDDYYDDDCEDELED